MEFLAKNAQWEHTTFYKSIDVSPSTSLSNLISSFVGSFFHQNTTESDRDFDRLNLRCWRARSMQWLGTGRRLSSAMSTSRCCVLPHKTLHWLSIICKWSFLQTTLVELLFTLIPFRSNYRLSRRKGTVKWRQLTFRTFNDAWRP